MTVIQGTDISRYQGENIDFNKMYANGARFVGIRFSQGINYRDSLAVTNYEKAKAAGLLVFPYHFTTTDNAIEQANWFKECMGDLKFDFSPAMDVEYYVSTQKLYGYQSEIEPVYEFRYNPPILTDYLKAVTYLLTVPTEAIVDSLGRQLIGYQGFTKPKIYTNVGSGNTVFKSAIMGERYDLWVAHWPGPTQPLLKPTLPNVWKTKGLYEIWQDGIVDGYPWGLPEGDKIDHNVWGTNSIFPIEEESKYSIKVYIQELNKTISGNLKEVSNERTKV